MPFWLAPCFDYQFIQNSTFLTLFLNFIHVCTATFQSVQIIGEGKKDVNIFLFNLHVIGLATVHNKKSNSLIGLQIYYKCVSFGLYRLFF